MSYSAWGNKGNKYIPLTFYNLYNLYSLNIQNCSFTIRCSLVSYPGHSVRRWSYPSVKEQPAYSSAPAERTSTIRQAINKYIYIYIYIEKWSRLKLMYLKRLAPVSIYWAYVFTQIKFCSRRRFKTNQINTVNVLRSYFTMKRGTHTIYLFGLLHFAICQ